MWAPVSMPWESDPHLTLHCGKIAPPILRDRWQINRSFEKAKKGRAE
jgi:hypothetical protein